MDNQIFWWFWSHEWVNYVYLNCSPHCFSNLQFRIFQNFADLSRNSMVGGSENDNFPFKYWKSPYVGRQVGGSKKPPQTPLRNREMVPNKGNIFRENCNFHETCSGRNVIHISFTSNFDGTLKLPAWPTSNNFSTLCISVSLCYFWQDYSKIKLCS